MAGSVLAKKSRQAPQREVEVPQHVLLLKVRLFFRPLRVTVLPTDPILIAVVGID